LRRGLQANPPITYAEDTDMTDTGQMLQDIVRVAQSGRDFFAGMGPRASQDEVRAAFDYLADVKKRLVNSLTIWASPTSEESERGKSTVTAVEKAYSDASRRFRKDAPASVAHALTFGEDQLLELTERAYATTPVPALRQLLKAYYAEIAICRQTMSRLESRLAA
jgi:hypothetical protein